MLERQRYTYKEGESDKQPHFKKEIANFISPGPLLTFSGNGRI